MPRPEGRVHQIAQFGFVHRRGDHQPRHGAEGGHVEDSVVRHAVLADQAAPVEAHHHRQVLDRHVVNHVVVGALHEGRIDIAEGNHPRGGQSGREGHGVSFGDAHVETAVGHLAHQNVHRTARRHGGRDAHHAGVEAGQFQQRLAEDVLVAGRAAFRGDPLARVGVEAPRGMPHRLIVLGRKVALALYGHDVQQLGSLDVVHRAQRPHQLPEVVAVHRSEVAEIEALEQIALVEHPLLDGVARLLAQAQQTRRMRQQAPQPLLEPVVVHRGRDLQQVVLQRARRLVDSHVVVVENHQQVGPLAGSGVVQPLERQAAGHRAVADHGHDLPPLAPQLGGLGHAERRGNRHRGVPAPEGVVLALGHARKAADASQAPLGPERLAAPRDDLVGVGLVADVPDDLVLGRVIDIVQRGGQLHGAEARGQMARIDRALVDDIPPQLVAIAAQLLRRELFQIARRGDRMQQFKVFRHFLFTRDARRAPRTGVIPRKDSARAAQCQILFGESPARRRAPGKIGTDCGLFRKFSYLRDTINRHGP